MSPAAANNQRTAFFISDGTGVTAETLGYSLISQFEDLDYTCSTLPFVDNQAKACEAATRINNVYHESKRRPLVFATLVNPELREIMANTNCHFIDFFSTFIGPLENELKMASSYTIGKTHSVHSPKNYNSRIEAINYTLNTDDGVNLHQYKLADLILVGVSRSGKTPTCLYLALQYGLKAANYPITEDDLHTPGLPKHLLPFKKKVFGLTIDPLRLQTIRNERRPASRYASLNQCQVELRQVELLFRREKLPQLNTTNLSVEEIAAQVMAELGIARKHL